MINVLLVEDHELYRMGLSMLIDKAEGIELCAQASDGIEGIKAARDKNAVIVGPNMQNFAEIMNRARFDDAVWQVNSAEDVVEETITLFRNPELLAERQQKAYQWTVKEEAVLDGIVNALKKVLK